MMIKINTNASGQILAFTPYNARFIEGAHKLNGKWNAAAKGWIFDPLARNGLMALLKDVYGYVEGDQVVTARLTAKDEIRVTRAPVIFAGRVIARAMDRDSGAKTGDGVILDAGRITSGGSMKNWETIIKEGARLIVRGLPASAAVGNQEWDVEIIPEDAPAPDAGALKEERARLVARLAEIDAQLSAMAAGVA